MFEAARTFIVRTLYERLVLPPLVAYVGRDTAHIVVVSAATYVVLASVRLLAYAFYRVTLRVADDCARTLYVGVLLVIVLKFVLPLFEIDAVERRPASSWWSET